MSPRFAVLAFKDPGSDEMPGTDLQYVQIIKGWVDAEGRTHEKVFDVAGEAGRNEIDTRTCGPLRPGSKSLCAIWQDPDFDPAQRAFYYARVLESPTCRWSTLVCRGQGVDPFAADCAAQAEQAGESFAACCDDESEDPFRERVVRERAWSSPIWYRPETIAAVEGGVELGAAPADDSVDLTIAIGQLPTDVDLGRDDIRVSLANDDEIYAVTLPGGMLASSDEGQRFVFRDEAGTRNGLRSFVVEIGDRRRAVLRLQAAALDLANAQRREHSVRVQVEIGAYRAEHARFWRATRNGLTPD